MCTKLQLFTNDIKKINLEFDMIMPLNVVLQSNTAFFCYNCILYNSFRKIL